MDLRVENINRHCPAGKQLDLLATLLPKQPRLDITVFGSAPLQIFLNPDFLSQDIDLYAPEENWDYLVNFVAENNLGQEKAKFYIQVCDPRAFRSTIDWPHRAVEVERHGHLFRFVHPWDVLVSKLQRLEDKDIAAFKLVIAKTGHPTEAEFLHHLQKAVDLYRPKFDEESARGDILLNTRELWKILWNKEIDVRAAIIRPALERSRHEYVPADPALKTRLANLKLPPKPPAP
jgi:hypothetical protein